VIAFLFAALFLAASCHPVGFGDSRCSSSKFYCLRGAEAENYLRSAPDTELIRIAITDHQTSRPPSDISVYEMARRGPSRSRAIMYRYASGSTDEALLDAMTRILTQSQTVCTNWSRTAPMPIQAKLRESCGRVFDDNSMARLKRSAEAIR